ncbi:MAG: hypothetical protein WC233_10210 [Sphaerochaeta sp.]|jgi:hypothetical protein
MLIKLTVDQVANLWLSGLKASIMEAMPAHVRRDEQTANNVLTRLMAEMALCWAIVEEDIVWGFVVTSLSTDYLSNTRNLILHAVYGFEEIPPQILVDAYNTINKYASAKDCTNIFVHSNSSIVLKTARKYGGSVNSFITIPVIGGAANG